MPGERQVHSAESGWIYADARNAGAHGKHWGYEDPVYRFFQQSFKGYAIQTQTEEIVRELSSLLPDRSLTGWFREIVARGTGRVSNWLSDFPVAVEWVSPAHPRHGEGSHIGMGTRF